MNKLLIAAIQMVSSDNVEDNLKTVKILVKKAVSQGARLLVLPENFALMASSSRQIADVKETLGEGRIQTFLAELAKTHHIWIIAGSLPIASSDPSRAYACSLVYDDSGCLVNHYNKIHLFDVDTPHKKHRYQESKTFYPGDQAVVIDSPFGKIGLSICYDLRFPELYRELIEAGATIIVAPSAFTHDTGLAHWELLCRTRAIENLCYIIAPNQGGTHSNGRQTYGHSMIVNPWGEVLGEATRSGEKVVLAEIDQSKLSSLRRTFPAIDHRRMIR